MAYTAQPYDPSKPISTDFAGNMYIELQAIKQRLNYQVGAGEVLPPALTLTARMENEETVTADIESRVASLETALPALAVRVTDLETWQTSHQLAYDAFVQGEADWKANIYTVEQGQQDTAISNNAQGLIELNNTITGLAKVHSGTTTPAPALGADGDVYFRYVP